MSIQNPLPPPGANGTPLLDAFRQEASRHDAVHVTLDDSSWRVHGVGVMPQSRREVAWVSADEVPPDATSVFVQALQQSFSSGISQAVARALDLQPSPGQPLSSRTVTQALDMAETGHKALSGVDFFTRLQFSAVADGPQFRRVCASLERAGSSLLPAQREHIDRQLEQRFLEAQSRGASPVPPEVVEGWLKQALG